MEIHFTHHAEDIQKERGFDRVLIEDVVLNPDWREETNDIWYAFRQFKGKVLRVVVKGKTEPFTVVTMYYDRRLKP
jgi:hypothetical protein